MILRKRFPASTTTVARVEVEGRTIRILFPEKRDDFRALAKESFFTWNRPYWERTYEPRLGDMTHRAAEICHRLLVGGISVCPPTPEVGQIAVAASYEPEPRRLILRRVGGRYDGWFAVWWARSEDCYDSAIKIPGAVYRSPHVMVPPEQFDEVVDFAELYGFGMSEAAKQLVEEAQATAAAAVLVDVRPLPVAPTTAAGRPGLDPDSVTDEIDNELADEPL